MNYPIWNVEYDTLLEEFKHYEQPLNYMTYGEFLKCFVVSLFEFVISNNDTFSDGRRPHFFRSTVIEITRDYRMHHIEMDGSK